MTLTIHEALSKIKLYTAKINSAMNEQFVVANRENNTKIDGVSITEKTEKFKSNFESLNSLIKNRNELKKAIAASNAVTSISIGDKEYTIVEAIEEKNFIPTKKLVLRNLKAQYDRAVAKANLENEKLPQAAENYLATIGMTDKNGRSKDEITEAYNTYIKVNTWSLIDPCKLGDKIKEMEDEIAEFEANIDFRLSESNATTVIEVDLLG
jgi:hypothetical protein